MSNSNVKNWTGTFALMVEIMQYMIMKLEHRVFGLRDGSKLWQKALGNELSPGTSCPRERVVLGNELSSGTSCPRERVVREWVVPGNESSSGTSCPRERVVLSPNNSYK